ncbi:MAG: hypothetical protein HY078_06925 [Elusimicrobia bacterium]|nr:hypothetical protein [Elusimicrobiota bacterium]
MSDPASDKAAAFLNSLRGVSAPPPRAATPPPPTAAPATAPSPAAAAEIEALKQRLEELEKKLIAADASSGAPGKSPDLQERVDRLYYRIEKLQEAAAPLEGPESEGTVRRLAAQMSMKWLQEDEARRKSAANFQAALLDLKDRLQGAEEHLVRLRSKDIEGGFQAQENALKKARERIASLEEREAKGLELLAVEQGRIAKLEEQLSALGKTLAAFRQQTEKSLLDQRADAGASAARLKDDVGRALRKLETDFVSVVLDVKERLGAVQKYAEKTRAETGITDANLKSRIDESLEPFKEYAREVARQESELARQESESRSAEWNAGWTAERARISDSLQALIQDLNERIDDLGRRLEKTDAKAESAQTSEFLSRVTDALESLQGRLDRVDERLKEASKPRPPAPPAPPLLAPPPLFHHAPVPSEPPPSDFWENKVAKLEAQLREAREEGLRAKIVLEEREEAQRAAQTEVERMFRTMREKSRQSQWDSALREQVAGSRETIGRLEARIRDLQASGQAAPFSGTAGGEPALPPSPPAAAPPESAESALVPRYIELIMGRIADLERRIEETAGEREDDKKRRESLAREIQSAVKTAEGRWRSPGGAKIVVEGAMESLAQTLKERDALSAEMTALLARMQEEPEASPALTDQRLELERANGRMKELQESLDRNMALVQAWLKEGTAS